MSEQDEHGELGEHVENTKFTTYPHENKQLVNLVNVVRKYFDVCARGVPKLGVGKWRGNLKPETCNCFQMNSLLFPCFGA
jgi:hypothetical protein